MPTAGAATSTDDDLLLERQLCFALSVASRSVVAAYRPVLEPMGLTHPQYLVMLALWERSPRTVRDISEARQRADLASVARSVVAAAQEKRSRDLLDRV